jgi:hypothetical protein
MYGLCAPLAFWCLVPALVWAPPLRGTAQACPAIHALQRGTHLQAYARLSKHCTQGKRRAGWGELSSVQRQVPREGKNGTAGRVAGCFEGAVLLPHSQAAMGLAACLITSSTTLAGRAARQTQPPPAGAGCLAPPLAAAPQPALPAPAVGHQQQGAGGSLEGVWPVLVGDGAPGVASCPKQQPAAVAIMS